MVAITVCRSPVSVGIATGLRRAGSSRPTVVGGSSCHATGLGGRRYPAPGRRGRRPLRWLTTPFAMQPALAVVAAVLRALHEAPLRWLTVPFAIHPPLAAGRYRVGGTHRSRPTEFIVAVRHLSVLGGGRYLRTKKRLGTTGYPGGSQYLFYMRFSPVLPILISYKVRARWFRRSRRWSGRRRRCRCGPRSADSCGSSGRGRRRR